MLVLNEANRNINLDEINSDIDETGVQPHIFTIALPKGTPEVKRMETKAEVLLENVRLGFAVAYDSLQIHSHLKVSSVLTCSKLLKLKLY